MREIKYRAWDKKTKKMRVVESIGFGTLSAYTEGYPVINLLGRDCIEDKNILLHREQGQYELMQYTGLKDKNGKEIYEGDIVSFYNDEEYKLKPTNAIVIYEAGAFMLEHKKLGKEYLGEIDIENMCVKVIGNIYENPELLEVEE